MLNFKRDLLISFLFAISTSLCAVEIAPYKKDSWQSSWTEALNAELGRSEYESLLSMTIDEADLFELNCKSYNQLPDKDKRKDFWIVFMSALTRAESAFNPQAGSIAPKGGHGNYGLLQFSKRTAREQCGLDTLEKIGQPEDHLRCGLKLLSWQLHGAPNQKGKLHRPDLKGQLFGKKIFLWGPLRSKDKKGRALLVGWFKRHHRQLAVCQPPS